MKKALILSLVLNTVLLVLLWRVHDRPESRDPVALPGDRSEADVTVAPRKVQPEARGPLRIDDPMRALENNFDYDVHLTVAWSTMEDVFASQPEQINSVVLPHSGFVSMRLFGGVELTAVEPYPGDLQRLADRSPNKRIGKYVLTEGYVDDFIRFSPIVHIYTQWSTIEDVFDSHPDRIHSVISVSQSHSRRVGVILLGPVGLRTDAPVPDGLAFRLIDASPNKRITSIVE